MPTVTVVVPCYKYGSYVTAAVTSILANTLVDLEIIVVDDASPDDSWSVVRRLPELDPRIRVKRNETNLGLIATANENVMSATGDYVVLLSADDALAPGWLDRAVAALEDHPEATFAYGRFVPFSADVPAVDVSGPARVTVHRGHDWLAARAASAMYLLASPEAVVRTSAQHAVGPYDPKLTHTSDMELWIRLASVGDVVQVIGPPAAMYRVSPASMSRSAQDRRLNHLLWSLEAFEAWHVFAEGRIDDRDKLLANAKWALGMRALQIAFDCLIEDPQSDDVDELCGFAVHCDRRLAAWTRRIRTLRSRPRLRPVLRPLRTYVGVRRLLPLRLIAQVSKRYASNRMAYRPGR